MPVESLAVRKLRIFLSSPGDVGQERLIATRVIERLGGEFAGYVELEPILWEHEPLRASDHFQAQILPPAECDICVCILWSRLGTRLPAQFRRADGTLYASGTEWEFENALESFQARGTPDLMVYRKTAEPQASMSDETALMARLEQKRALDAFIEKWFGSARDTFRAAFHTFDTPDRFEATLETHLRRLIRERLPKIAEEGAAPGTGATIRWHTGSPFRGLSAFEVVHAPVFFGRTRAVAAIQERLVQVAGRGCAFVLVFGMSGCGKSSLVKAGVIPTLTQPGVVDGVGLWRYGIFRPTDAPGDLFLALAGGLLEPTGLPELADAGFDLRELALLLRQAPERAVAAIRKALARAAEEVAAHEGLPRVPEARFALLADQLEEIFTLPGVDEHQREGFAAALSALARSGVVWVVATMRSDFYHRCAEIPELAALKEGAGQYDVLPATFTEIGQMIRAPARAAGLAFETRPGTGERLDDVLHEAAARDPEALPLLSFTLDQLFQERTERGLLRFDAYERLGGLEGALARRAEETFAAQPPDVQAALPGVLRGLVTVGVRGESVVAARRVPLAGLATTPARTALVDAFLAARLLAVDRADDGRTVVRVTHEALLRHWPRLASILDEDRVFLQTRDHVAQAAARWREEGRRPDFLLADGKSLADAVDIHQRRPDDLDEDLTEYVVLSRKQVEGRRRRRVAAISGVVGAFLLSASLFGAFSYAQWRRTEERNRLAVDAVDKLTLDIPLRLGEVPGTRPVLRALLEENEALLDRLGDTRGASGDRFDNALATGDVWLLLGETRRAEGAFARALTLAGDAARRAPDAAPARFNRATATARLGDILLQRGDPAGAQARYDAARAELEALAQAPGPAADPGLPLRLRRALSSVYDKVGDAHLAQGRAKEARDAFERDVSYAREAVAAAEKGAPRDAAQLGLALAQMKMGDARRALGEAQAAMDAYGESLTLLDALARTDAVAGREGGALLLRMASLLHESGDTPGAVKTVGQSLEALRATLRRRPDVATQRYLADAYRQMGDLRLTTGDLGGGLAAYDRALAYAREVAGNDPDNVLAQGILADTLRARSLARGQKGDRAGALADHEEALGIALAQARREKTPAAQREQAGLLRDLSQARLERGNRAGALDAAEEAVRLWLDLASGRGAKDRETTRALADAYDRVAFLFLLRRQPDLAVAAAREGIARAPDAIRLKLTEAHALLLSGRFDEARARYLANRTARLDDRERFDRRALSDIAELRAQGVDHPDFRKIESLLTTTRP